MKTNDKLFYMVWRQTLLAMVMMILSNIGTVLIDGLITSKAFGANASAAMGLIAPYVMLVSLVGGLIGTGCQTLCSNALGNGEKEQSSIVLATSVWFGVAVSVVMAVMLFVFANPICLFLGASGSNAELLKESREYLRTISPGTAGMVLNIIFAPAIQLYAGRIYVNLSVSVTFVSDIILDFLAVFLNAGCRGIGLATTASTYLGTIVMLIYVLSPKSGICLSVGHFRINCLKPVLKQGLPEALKRLFRMAQDILLNYLVLSIATGAALAGKTVGSLLASVLSVVGLGAASAMYLLSGVYIASKDTESILKLGRCSLRYFLISLLLSMTAFLFAPSITRWMLKADGETLRTAVVYVRCLLAQIPVYILTEMICCYLQSIGRAKSANRITLVADAVLFLPFLLVMRHFWGACGVLLSVPASLLCALLIFYIMLCVQLKRPAKLPDILFIRDCVERGTEVIGRSTILCVEDAMACSKSMHTVLAEKGCDKKTAFAVALFVEEICSNIFIHGKTKKNLFGETPKCAEVFAYIENEMITLRISDNCVLFDPTEKWESIAKDQGTQESGLGLRLVFGMADEADYTSMLNMNHMLIRVPMHGGKFSHDGGTGCLKRIHSAKPLRYKS